MNEHSFRLTEYWDEREYFHRNFRLEIKMAML